jgi:hypothetical protein
VKKKTWKGENTRANMYGATLNCSSKCSYQKFSSEGAKSICAVLHWSNWYWWEKNGEKEGNVSVSFFFFNLYREERRGGVKVVSVKSKHTIVFMRFFFFLKKKKAITSWSWMINFKRKWVRREKIFTHIYIL